MAQYIAILTILPTFIGKVDKILDTSEEVRYHSLMTELVDTVAELGLTKQESAVYLAALETGFSSISDIDKKAGIKRPTTYYIVDELIKKNLISRAPKGKRTFYIAEHPNTLLANLRAQEDRLMSQLPLLES